MRGSEVYDLPTLKKTTKTFVVDLLSSILCTHNYRRPGACATFPGCSEFFASKELAALNFDAFGGKKGSSCRFDLCCSIDGTKDSGLQVSL